MLRDLVRELQGEEAWEALLKAQSRDRSSFLVDGGALRRTGSEPQTPARCACAPACTTLTHVFV
eukprot:COSAG01_NODE_2282_length_8004_cov_3.883491_4_plen_64_part_00